MRKFMKALITSCFFLSLSFILGICVLFLINVPFEAFLVKQNLSQGIVDFFMLLLIILWFLLSILFTVVYYIFWVNDASKRGSPLYIVFVMIILSSVIFTVIIKDNNPVLQTLKGEEENVSFITTGPYPDINELRRLKDEGYVGVISLLNPVIPFENILLEKEQILAKQLNLKVYSFPMLPWISDNKTKLDEISKVVKQQKGRYYIHCYLGKHRANLAKKYLIGSLDNYQEQVILPDSFERGKISIYRNGKVIVGPYPTQEEWLAFILLSDIKTIITYLDPDLPENEKFIAQERKMCSEMGLDFKTLPINAVKPDTVKIKELAKYAIQAPGNVYIHGFKEDEISSIIGAYLTITD